MIDEKKLIKEICNTECKVPEFETDELLNAFLLGLNARQICVMDLIAKQPKVGEWIPVEEGTPDNTDLVDITYLNETYDYDNDGMGFIAEYLTDIAYYSDGEWFDEFGDIIIEEVTAWKPRSYPYYGDFSTEDSHD